MDSARHTDGRMFGKLRKGLLICSTFVALASGALYAVLENTYVTYPRLPDQTLGRIVPHNAKGVVVYISARQSEMVAWDTAILIVSGAFVLAGLLLNLKASTR
jgi:hypothetical protein